MSDLTDLDFLGQLGRPDSVEQAWSEFVARFSPLLLAVARRHASADDQVLDCYLHVCQCLIDNDYRRLRAFKRGGSGEFAGWLAAVARNLCIDLLRTRQGRRRLPAAVARLDEVEREVFAAIYWDGLSAAEALDRLRSRWETLTPFRVRQALDRIGTCLRPYQLAEIAVGRSRRGATEPEELAALPDGSPDPEAEYLSREQLALLAAEVAQLSPCDRSLLRLRFEQGLTLAQTAAALGLGDYRKAHVRLGRILAQLRERLGGRTRP